MKCTLKLLRNHCVIASFAIICLFLFAVASAAEPLRETSDMFPPGLNGVARYRIPGVVVTPEGTVLAYCAARRNNSSDWGEIEIHLRHPLVVVSMPDHPGCLSTVE
ncbi:MAG: sialidase family protein [Planctomycetales bacterium]|nr:sialidase family protein [Planctomycetales bacterium]